MAKAKAQRPHVGMTFLGVAIRARGFDLWFVPSNGRPKLEKFRIADTVPWCTDRSQLPLHNDTLGAICAHAAVALFKLNKPD